MFDDEYPEPTFTCPNCGADVPIKAESCPQCGSDDETGWSEEAGMGRLFRVEADSDDRIRPGIPLWQKIVSVFLAYLLAAPLATLFEPSSRGFALLTTILFIAIAYLVFVHYMGGNINTLFSPRQTNQTYTRLLQRARGDQALVERLIQYEQSRNPTGSRKEWEQDALLRWERER